MKKNIEFRYKCINLVASFMKSQYYKFMSKVLCSKHILLLGVLFFLSNSVLVRGQGVLNIRGYLLMDSVSMDYAEIVVFDGEKVVTRTSTKSSGSFAMTLASGRIYVLQFKKNTISTQKVILDAKTHNTYKAKNSMLNINLTSKKSSKEGHSKSSIVGVYEVQASGNIVSVDKTALYNKEEEKENKDEAEKVNDSISEKVNDTITKVEIKKVEDDIKKKIEELADNKQNIDIEDIKRKKDSILMLAYKKAELIVLQAKKEAEIIKEARRRFERKYNRPIINLNNNIHKQISADLKRFAISESDFFSQKKVKNYHDLIRQYSKKDKLSSTDSLEYLKVITIFNEEIIKSAWLQLQIDKLNARTHEDSIMLHKRELEIRTAEKKIQEAKMKIKLQDAEITRKNNFIMLVVLLLLFLVTSLALLYRSFTVKKRNNKILARKNAEIAKNNKVLARKNREIETKNKKILDSIRYAQTIQQAVLPTKSINDSYFEWFVVFLPKDIVSGDFYWFHEFDELNLSVFAVVDCTGHGVPGAFMSLIGNRLLVEAVKEKGISNPVDILEEIDKGIRIALMQDETENNDGMDVCVCTIERLDETKRKVCFAGAKRPIFYTEKGEDEIKYIKGTVRGIGGRKRLRKKSKKSFQEHELLLDKDEKLYLTSDGFFDLQSPERKKYGRIKFMNLLQLNKDKVLADQELEIIKAIEKHGDTEPQIDDITILGIKL